MPLSKTGDKSLLDRLKSYKTRLAGFEQINAKVHSLAHHPLTPKGLKHISEQADERGSTNMENLRTLETDEHGER